MMRSILVTICFMMFLVGHFATVTGQNTRMSEQESRLSQAIVWLEHDAEITNLLPKESTHLAVNYSLNRCLSKRLNIWLLDLSAEQAIQRNQMKQLRQHPAVKMAQYNHHITFRKAPNDPLFNSQWERSNTGQASANIHAQEAWDITTGGLTQNGDTIVLALLDDGLDIDHEDLEPNMWKNRDEIPYNDIDDDSNGYVDDYHGWDYYNGNDSIYPGSHGTPLAGIMGARGNNNIGVAGINWNVQMMPVAVETNEAAVVEAYSYVLDFRIKYNETDGEEGAFVVATNASFGHDYFNPDSFPIWCNMYDTLGKHGILSVAATMNSDEDVDEVHDMPTGCSSDYLITVTSTNRNDELSAQSGYGAKSIDLGAPGEDIQTTAKNDQYGDNWSGTSFAAPQVTGAVGLLYSSSCQKLTEDARQYPDSLALTIKRFIMEGTDSLPSLVGKTVTGGRLNLFESIKMAENYSDCQMSYVDDPNSIGDQFGIVKITPNPASEHITVEYANLKTGNNRFILTDATGRRLQQWEDGIKGAGLHSRQFDVGHLPAGIYFLRINTGMRQSPSHKFVVK